MYTPNALWARYLLPLEQCEREQQEKWDWISIKKIILIPGIKLGQNPV